MSRALALDLIRSRNNRISKLGIVEALREMAENGKLAVHGTNGSITSLEISQDQNMSECEEYLVVTLFRNGTFTPGRSAMIRGDELRYFGRQTALKQGLVRPLPFQPLLWLIVVALFAAPYGYLVANSDANFTLAVFGLVFGFICSVTLAMFISKPVITSTGKQALAAAPPLPPEWQRLAELCESNAIRICDMPDRR